MANRFEGTLRKEDTFGRLGGDDFIILLPNLADEYFPAKMAQRVLDIMKQPLTLKENQFHSNFSIGITLFPDDGKDVETLFKNSNIAMYQAKKSGGHAYRLYESSMHDKIITRLALEQDLWNAINNKESYHHRESCVNNGILTSRSHVKKMFKLNVTDKDSLCVRDAKHIALVRFADSLVQPK